MKLTKQQILAHVCGKTAWKRIMNCIHILDDGIYSSDGKRLMIVGYSKEQKEAFKDGISIPKEVFAKFAKMMPKPRKNCTELPFIKVSEDEENVKAGGDKMAILSTGDMVETVTMKTPNVKYQDCPPNFKAVIPDNTNKKIHKFILGIDMLIDSLKQMKSASNQWNVEFEICEETGTPIIMKAVGGLDISCKSQFPRESLEVKIIQMPIRKS